MTKEELSRLRSIQKEIDIIRREIDATTEEYVADKVTGSTTYHPYIFTSFRIEGYGYNSKLKRLERRLKRKLEEIMDERERLEEYIESVDDDITRMILRLRYINGLGWNQIGNELGYSERQIRRKHAQWIGKL